MALTSPESDANNDGYVTGSELSEFLQTNVVNYSNNSQHPQYGKIRHPALDKGDFVFVIPKRDQVDLSTDPDKAEYSQLNDLGPPEIQSHLSLSNIDGTYYTADSIVEIIGRITDDGEINQSYLIHF